MTYHARHALLTAGIVVAVVVLTAPMASLAAQTIPPGAAPDGPLVPRYPGVKGTPVRVAPTDSPTRVHVKFLEGTLIRLRNGRLVTVGRDRVTGLNQFFATHSGIVVERLFTRPEADLDRSRQEAESRSGRAQADKNLYFRFLLPEGTDTEAVLAELNALDVVETAYPEPLPAPPPATPSFVANQGYRNAAPDGVGVAATSAVPGGKGQNVKIIDIEYSWNTNHEDLSKARLPGAVIPNGIPADPFVDDNHGTAVLGELVGDENAFGITGLASGASVGMVNAYSSNAGYQLANAIDLAAAALATGDVILLEQQVPGPFGGANYVPVEWILAYYDAIVEATSAGIIVVEAAGNGGQNLDDPAFGTRFPANRPDSGAIIVGAGGAPGCSSPPRSRLGFSTYGTRVDLQGWGQCVATTGYGALYAAADKNSWYTSGFTGTSSASPIVASAAAILSSIAEQRSVTRNPTVLRSLLTSTGTPQAPAPAGHIGPLPNLAAATVLLGRSLPAVVRASTTWIRGDAPADGAATQTATFGTKPTAPLYGDWNGDGSRTPASYEAGIFKIRNDYVGGAAETTISFGSDPRGFPVAGDFDGNGTDDVAVFRNGLWQIRLSTGTTTTFNFGAGAWPATVPVSGDWDGDGIDGIGLYNYTTGAWTLRDTASAAGTNAASFVYWAGAGSASYPVVGDWDANGTDTVGVKAASSWLLRNTNGSGAAEITFTFGLANDLPLSWR